MIEEWVQRDLGMEGQIMFHKLLKDIQKTENHLHWNGFRRFIKRKEKRIWELGFFADGVQYRVLGDFVGEKEAVLLMGCYHKGGNYTPTNALEQAFTRRDLLKNGTATHFERKVRTDQ